MAFVKKSFYEGVITFFLLSILLFLLYWRFQLGLVRYFDIDEFAHLHWAYNFFSGMRPYTDFLYFFPPGFLLYLYPIFSSISDSSSLLLAGRLLMFLTFLMLLGFLFLLVRLVRNIHVALLTLVILSFLPIPYDKFLEIRPDTLAVGLAIGGMWVLARGMGDLRGVREKKLFLSGLLYSLAMMIVPKVVLFVVAAGATLSVAIPTLSAGVVNRIKMIGIFLAGLSVPLVATLLFFAWSGEFAKAIYLTTIFASSSSKILGSKFYMFPSHFFWPNDVYYGEGGFNESLIATLVMYLVGIVWGIKSPISFLDKPTLRQSWGELLVSLTFLLNMYAFVKIVPLKHAQYFIMFAPFTAFYVADFIVNVFHLTGPAARTRHPLILIFQSICFLLFLSFIALKSYTMYKIKSQWTNHKTFQELATIQKAIPSGSYVWDLYGQTIVYKDPYYVCCIPYGQYEEAFGFALPPLRRGLEETNTDYISVHNEGRLSVLPGKDADYIKNHFVPLTQDPLILKRKT